MDFFIRRPKFAIVIALVLTLAGGISIRLLPLAEYPPIAPPSIVVSTHYAGASAEVVEQTVGATLESVINGVEDMLYMSSKSANDGSYRLTITFALGTDPDLALIRVQNRTKLAEPRLPVEVRSTGLIVDIRSPDILMLASFFSPDESLDYAFISNYLKINVQNRLKRIKGVANVNILGEADYSMRLWLNPDRMANYSISTTDVLNALREQNVQVAAGKLGAPPFSGKLQTEYTLQAKGRLETEEEFSQVILRANQDGSTIYLKDIAWVELGQADYSIVGELNGKPAANLAIYALADANALEVGESIKAELESLAEDFPGDLKHQVGYDTTRYVSVAIRQVIRSLVLAVALVTLITYIFLGSVRMTLIPAIAIPVSLISTFSVLLALGMTVNTITLFALVLAIGIVVDDAILVIENVDRHLKTGDVDSVTEATKKTMREVSGPILATTLVLLAVFIPVTLLPGITGQLYRQFAMTICVAVCFSTLSALTLSPALCKLLLKKDQVLPRWFIIFNGQFNKIRSAYSVGVGWLNRRIILLTFVYILLICSTAYLFIASPTSFVPSEDKGVLLVNLQLPDASSIQRTQEAMKKISNMISRQPEVESVTAITGFSILSGASQSNTGTLFVVLKHWDDRQSENSSVFALTRRINGMAYLAMPEAQVYAIAPPAIPGMGVVGGLELVVEDTLARPPHELASTLNTLVAGAHQRPEFSNVFSTFRANVPQYFIDIDRQKAKNLGISLNEVFSTLQAQLGSLYINDFSKYGQSYRVIMQAQNEFRSDLDDLDALYVKSEGGEMIPVSTIATTRPILGPDVVERYNLYRAAIVRGNPAPGVSSGAAISAFEELANEVLPKGYRFEWTGMTLQQIKAGNLAVYAYALAMIFVYLFLVAQYESWSIPFAIVLVVPIAMLGALALVVLTGGSINLYTQIGIVLLIGLAAKNAILIIEFAKQQREKGVPLEEAARNAAHLRFRAVMMTALSFILGILPLVFATGAGMFSQRAVGMTVLGGMLVVLLLGTFFIPGFFVMVERARLAVKKRLLD